MTGFFSALRSRANPKKVLIGAVLAAVLLLGAGAALGFFAGKNSAGLSERLERSFGTMNVTGVSCSVSGSELNVTAEMGYIPRELEGIGDSGRFYDSAFMAVRREVLHDPFYEGIGSMRMDFRFLGETRAVVTSERNKPGDSPFGRFEARYTGGGGFSAILD